MARLQDGVIRLSVVLVQLADRLGLLKAQAVMAGLFTAGGLLCSCAPQPKDSPSAYVPLAVMSTGRFLVGLGVYLFNIPPPGSTQSSADCETVHGVLHAMVH
jgi:MFS family permease